MGESLQIQAVLFSAACVEQHSMDTEATPIAEKKVQTATGPTPIAEEKVQVADGPTPIDEEKIQFDCHVSTGF